MNPRFLAAAILSLHFTLVEAWAGNPNQPPDGKIVLPIPVQKVSLKKEILSQHPRIFLDRATVEAFRKKLKHPDVDAAWKRYLRWTDYRVAQLPPPALNSDNLTRSVGDLLPQIAFAYLVTQDDKYLEGSRKWVRAVIAYPTWTTDDDLGAAHVEFGLALTYDWLYSRLAPEERQAMAKSLRNHGRILLDRSARYPGSWWGYAYFQNHCWINHTGIAVAAMALYDTDPTEMQRWLDYTRTQFETTYRHLGIDGGYHEGPGYMDYGTVWILHYIEALRSVSGEDLSDMPYLKKLTRHYLDVYLPDHRNTLNFGDCYSLGWQSVSELPILPWLAAHQKDGHAEWLRSRNAESFKAKPSIVSPFTLLWWDPSIEPQSPQDLPTTGLYPDLGLVVFRSSWKDDAAVVALRCGPPGGHHIVNQWQKFPKPAPTFGHSHPDANSFLFFSNGQWRIGAPGGYTHDKKPHAENVWMAGGKGQRGGDLIWFEPATYFVPGRAQPHLDRVAGSVEADYAVGEAAPAYEDDCQLVEFRRHLLLVKTESPYVVVYDRLKASEPKAWRSYLHTYGEIVISDASKPSSAPRAGSSAVESFTVAGSTPETEGWQAFKTPPRLTPAHGVVLGPPGIVLETAPLTVLNHETNKPKQMGFELIAERAAPSDTTWLVTVIGVEKPMVTLTKAAAPPALKVGKDTIAWDAEGNVSLNGKMLTGNLLLDSVK
jgi:hypothetical protein